MENFLMHYGKGHDSNPPGRGSGRYPKGSGKNPYQHETTGDFYTYVQQLESSRLKLTQLEQEVQRVRQQVHIIIII